MIKKLLFIAGALVAISYAQQTETITENIEAEVQIPVVTEVIEETPVTEVTEVTVVEEITPVTEVTEEITVVQVEEVTVVEEVVPAQEGAIEGEFTGTISGTGTVEGTIDVNGLEIKGANLVTVPAAMFAVVAGLALLN